MEGTYLEAARQEVTKINKDFCTHEGRLEALLGALIIFQGRTMDLLQSLPTRESGHE